jgi:hypothetical protein
MPYILWSEIPSYLFLYGLLYHAMRHTLRIHDRCYILMYLKFSQSVPRERLRNSVSLPNSGLPKKSLGQCNTHTQDCSQPRSNKLVDQRSVWSVFGF